MVQNLYTFPPGPGFIAYPRLLLRGYVDPLRCLELLRYKYGDIVYFRLTNTHFFLLNDPEHIYDVLVTHHQLFHKYPSSKKVAKLFGRGLIVDEGPSYKKRRHIMQPAFHRQKITEYTQPIIETTQQRSLQWFEGKELNIAQEMRYLTLTIIAKIILGIDITKEVSNICSIVDALLINYNPFGLLSLKSLLEMLLPSLQSRFEVSLAQLNYIVSRLIKEAQIAGCPHHDLLSILLHAHENSSQPSDMNAEQIHDEILNVLIAGHETIANALTWSWYLLARHPHIEAKFHAELRSVLNGRLPTIDDIAHLRYTRMILTEAMRLYPPVWAIARKSYTNLTIGGYSIPSESVIIMSQYLVHRDARYYSHPLEFIPERWGEEQTLKHFKCAYFPFGCGPFIGLA